MEDAAGPSGGSHESDDAATGQPDEKSSDAATGEADEKASDAAGPSAEADDELKSVASKSPKKYKKRRLRLSTRRRLHAGKVQTQKVLNKNRKPASDDPQDVHSTEPEPLPPKMSISTVLNTTMIPSLLEDIFDEGMVPGRESDDNSCMSANASLSDTDSRGTSEKLDLEDLFSEDCYSSNDSCDALDDWFDETQDFSEDTSDKGADKGIDGDCLFSNFNSVSSATNWLAEKINDLLSETSWIVDSTDNTCRLFLLSNQANVVVQRSVYWNSTNRQLEMYINNQPVPSNSFLWTERFPTDFNNLASVANYITMVAFLLGSVNICAGVPKHEDFWHEEVESGNGYVESDIYQGSKCYRPTHCSLGIISSGSCSIYNKTLEKFRKRDWKRTQLPGKDLSKQTNISMGREELMKKAEEKQKLIKQHRRKIGRWRIRIKKLIDRDIVAIDQHLSADFTKILRENAHKMSPIRKLFWQEQLKALSRQENPKSMRWNPMSIKIALKLQEISPAALDYLRGSGFLSLPSRRTLYDFSHFADPKEGVQDAILELLEEKLKKKAEDLNKQGTSGGKFVYNLLFDEMTVKEDLVMNKHGEIVGYMHLNKVEEAFKNLEDELLENKETTTGVAKKILVYMLQGINTDLHEVVGIFSTINLNAAQLYQRTWDVIYNLERRSIPVITLICDAASVNTKFFKMHVSWNPQVKFVYSTKNVACGENRPIFFILDPPHLLKSLRNCLSNSGAYSNSRSMWKNDQELKWTPIHKLQEKDAGNKFRAHKLTEAHVKLTSFSRMRVSLAVQVLSMSVAEALAKVKEDENFKEITSSELILFLKLCNRFFDCLNGSEDSQGLRHKMNDDLLPYTNVEDSRFEFLETAVLGYFDNWLMNIEGRAGKFTKTEQSKMFISRESYESLYITVHGFCGAVKYCLQGFQVASVDARNFNQDKLEQEFGLFRMSEGANNHPTLNRVIQRSMSRHVSKAAALPPKRGNTEATKRTLTVDEEPLMRKRRRVENE